MIAVCSSSDDGVMTIDVHINMSDGKPSIAWVDPHLRATYTLKKMLERGFTTVRDVVGFGKKNRADYQGGATFFQKEGMS